jgi:hypothetical protein
MAVRADVPRALCKRSGPRRNPGPDFLRGCLPWFHGTRLRDTFHGTMGSIERVARPRGRPDAGDHVTRRTETTRDGARRARRQAARQRGRKLFPMQHLAAISTRGITYGFRITKARCRTRRKIACSSSKQSGGTSLKSIFTYRSWNDCRVPA